MKKELGFAYVEVLVIIVAVSVLGFIGYRVTQKDNDDKTSSSNTSVVADDSSSKSSVAKSDKDKGVEALAVVTNVYDKYVAVGTGSTEGAVSNAKANSTEAFVAKQTESFDYYVCAQDIPASVNYGEPVVSGDNVTFKVTEKFGDSNVVVSVVVDSKVNKISGVTCE